MPRRALSTPRRAAASSSSSTWRSGASAASASSAAVTAMSFACNANNGSRSGCTTPPSGYTVLRKPSIALGDQPLHLTYHAILLRRRGQGERPLELVHLPLEAPRLDPIHRPLEQRVGQALFSSATESFRLEVLVGPRRRIIQSLGGVLRDRLEDRAIGRELDVLRPHRFEHLGPPGLPLEQQQQQGLLRVGRRGDGG